MRKRDRIQTRFRSLFNPDPTNSALSSTGTQQTPSPSPSPSKLSASTSNGGASAPAAIRNQAFEKAVAKYLEGVPEAEKAVFRQASKSIDEHTLLSNVRKYDAAHKMESSFRPQAERLSKFLGLLNRFMGGVAIGLQANPEVSALVVGAVRIVIDLALHFTTFFSRLTDMLCNFEDYLGPLAVYGQTADSEILELAVVDAYTSVLDFGWKARRVFIGANGERRRWTSFRTFMLQHWETFESEFVSIKEDMQHHLNVILHSVQALHYDDFKRTEQARRREDDSWFHSWPPPRGILVDFDL